MEEENSDNNRTDEADKSVEQSSVENAEMKISDLKAGQGNVNIIANVTNMEEPKEITTRMGRTMVANATLEDDSGAIKLVLWGDQTQQCKEGDKVKISNGFIKEWNNEKQVSLGKYGKLEKV